MRGYKNQNIWQQARGKKRAHWTVLTLDDLDKTNEKHRQLVAQFQARYQAAKELGDAKPSQKPEDFSI